jgi:hypothetical protein
MACFRFATGVANSWSIDSRLRTAQADCGGQDLWGTPACGAQQMGIIEIRRIARESFSSSIFLSSTHTSLLWEAIPRVNSRVACYDMRTGLH